MPYMDGGDMKSMCKKKGQFPERTAQFYGAQLVLTLSFCTVVGLFTGRQLLLFLCTVVIEIIVNRSAYISY